MTEETGVMEAFSFKKGVVKINCQWLHFGPELIGSIKRIKWGDSVRYTVESRMVKRIEKVPQMPAATQTTLRPVSVPAAPASVAAPDNRNRSIERQCALKAAVELAPLFGFKSPDQCLEVAADFAEWISEKGTADLAVFL